MTSAFHLEADIQVFPGTKADLTAEVASNSGLTTREAHYSATPYPWVAGDITVCPSEHPKDLLLASAEIRLGVYLQVSVCDPVPDVEVLLPPSAVRTEDNLADSPQRQIELRTAFPRGCFFRQLFLRAANSQPRLLDIQCPVVPGQPPREMFLASHMFDDSTESGNPRDRTWSLQRLTCSFWPVAVVQSTFPRET